jgi:hypothetical protein
MLSWWYSNGWKMLFRKIKNGLLGIAASFSVSTLIKTLGQPWRQIVTMPNPNQTIQEKIRAVGDNLVSRVVGLMVRSVTLLAALAVMVLGSLGGILALVAWPLVPLLVPALLLKTVGIL